MFWTDTRRTTEYEFECRPIEIGCKINRSFWRRFFQWVGGISKTNLTGKNSNSYSDVCLVSVGIKNAWIIQWGKWLTFFKKRGSILEPISTDRDSNLYSVGCLVMQYFFKLHTMYFIATPKFEDCAIRERVQPPLIYKVIWWEEKNPKKNIHISKTEGSAKETFIQKFELNWIIYNLYKTFF
jgi:hypothetical protein